MWPLHRPSIELAAHRENAVFCCGCREGVFALRLHRKGYRSDGELASELDYMAALATGDVQVPQPLTSRAGRLVERVDDTQVSVLNWVGGVPLGQTGWPLQIANRMDTFHRFGALIARMHDLSDAWSPPAEFIRKRWDRDGLLGEAPQWGRFWDNPLLTEGQCNVMHLAREKLRAFMESRTFDTGLIHADLVSENILVDGETLRIIDFDDSGFGFRAQDMATALVKHQAEPDYVDLKAALLSGYRALRGFDAETLEPFLLMRHLSYLGWIVPRMETDAGLQRCRAFIERAVPMAERYIYADLPL
jgi:Ser/Thr protein kinase RdoA (MazF antagonist)